MLVCLGEAIGYGDMEGTDPGAQWLHELSDIGGPERLDVNPDVLVQLALHLLRHVGRARELFLLLLLPFGDGLGKELRLRRLQQQPQNMYN